MMIQVVPVSVETQRESIKIIAQPLIQFPRLTNLHRGIFQPGEVASEELNAISELNLAFRTKNNERCRQKIRSTQALMEEDCEMASFQAKRKKENEERANKTWMPSRWSLSSTNQLHLNCAAGITSTLGK